MPSGVVQGSGCVAANREATPFWFVTKVLGNFVLDPTVKIAEVARSNCGIGRAAGELSACFGLQSVRQLGERHCVF